MNLLATYQHSADRALNWLSSRLQADGSYNAASRDLACYYKAPYLFYLSGRLEEAHRILSYIKKTFGRANQDFTTTPTAKSENDAFNEYWAYPNAWIALTAQKMGRFDIAYPAYQYLQGFYHPGCGGFTTHQPYGQGDNEVDILTTAHLGLTALYFGDLTKATGAGKLLRHIASQQPDLKTGFYLRQREQGEVVTSYPHERAVFYHVSATQPNQAYFMIGYPIAFLGQLYRATGEEEYLATAQWYLDFALACQGNLRAFHLSHKVAWGAALLANLTQDTRYRDLAREIADFLVSLQAAEGGWLQAEPAYTAFDQTTEIAIWLQEIQAELRPLESSPC